ncbi:hypothetical protein TRFO_29247 [Tritrichomonas foetus]|uniref:Right handed beta helix domain-containing protein n=1 Tax=Tritrichomonas foetus TaxID=1144522 RepID=A0A1J4JWK0_9EUKA|nr:hypothetical protein TRFO_29247 [Tritrichomonas foetus]|eukprot:OHT03379.1 hypothetical protein TRFO_29247 [Tritrichomonas foetus]
MLNTSLLALSLGSLTSMSPFLSQQQNIYIKNSNLFNSYSNFIYNAQSLVIKSTKFSNFLDSAIMIQRQECIYNKEYTERPDSPKMNDNIICQDAMFIKCIAKVDGGAFSHFSPDSGSLSVSRTTFIECQSGLNPGDGGCIYFSGRESYINSSCVYKCSAGRDGHSFCISIRNELPNPNHCNSTVILMSSPKSAARGWQSLYLGFGKIRITDLNSTENAVVTQAGSFMMHTMDSDAIALHCTIKNNIGPWIVYLFGKQGSKIEQSNFVGNKLAKSHEQGLIMFHRLGQINNCIFSHPEGKLFKQNREGAEITVNNCVFDCPFDDEKGVALNNCKFLINDLETLPLAHLHTAMCVSNRDLMKNPIGEADIVMKMKKYFPDPKKLLKGANDEE